MNQTKLKRVISLLDSYEDSEMKDTQAYDEAKEILVTEYVLQSYYYSYRIKYKNQGGEND